MIKVGNIILNGVPRVAIVVSDKENNKSIKSARADIVEIRIDQFERLDIGYIKDKIITRRKLNIPLILTIRSKEEGGEKNISDERKFNIFKDVISLGDAVDIELRFPLISKIVNIAKKNKKIVIVSWHDFKSTPNNKILKNILTIAKKEGAHLIKIAAKANKSEDVNRLMNFTQENKRMNIITIALGNIGAISRLVFPLAGSLITYSYINKPFAAGQIPLSVLQTQLRFFYPQYNQRFIEKSGIREDA